MTHSEKVGFIVCLIIVLLIIGLNSLHRYFHNRQAIMDSEMIYVEILEQNRADSLRNVEIKRINAERKAKKDSIINLRKKNRTKKIKKKSEPRDFINDPID